MSKFEIKDDSEVQIFYVYLDIENLFVAWSAYCGILYPTKSFEISLWLYNRLKQNHTYTLNEFRLEAIRQKCFPEKVSRFAGYFCFENKVDANIAKGKWGKRFSQRPLVEIGVTSNSILTKVDSNWITYNMGTLTNIDTLNEENINEYWMYKYWNGEPFPSEESIWELISNMPGSIYGTEHRQIAYVNLKSKLRLETLPFLELSRIAQQHLGYDLGRLYLICEKNDSEQVIKSCINIEDLNAGTFQTDYLNFIQNPNNANLINNTDLNLAQRYGGVNLPDLKNFNYCLSKSLANIFDINKIH